MNTVPLKAPKGNAVTPAPAGPLARVNPRPARAPNYSLPHGHILRQAPNSTNSVQAALNQRQYRDTL